MIVKNISHLLLVRLRLFFILAKLTPLLLLMTPMLIFIAHFNTDNYKFQEPSLKTKIFDITKSTLAVPFKNIEGFPSVSYVILEGLLRNQCILIVSPKGAKDGAIKIAYETLRLESHLAKNVAFLKYDSREDLQRFLVWYTSTRDGPFDLGIIRAALNIEQGSETANYFQFYGRVTHGDTDFFQAIKELMELVSLDYHLCESVRSNGIYRQAIRLMSKAQRSLFKDGSYYLYLSAVLCELHTHFTPVSTHQILMQNGFPAATLKSAKSVQLAKVVVSFVKEFSMQEDHLHSADTLFYPYNAHQYINLKMLIIPNLVLLLLFVVKQISQIIEKREKIEIQLSKQVIIFSYVAGWEYYISGNLTYSLPTLFLSCIYRTVKPVARENVSNRACLIAVEALIGVYFSVFSTGLGYLCLLLTLVMIVTRGRWMKLGVWGGVWSGMIGLGWAGCSVEFKSILVPFLIFMSM